METNNQIVYTNWDACNDLKSFGLTRKDNYAEWKKRPKGVYLYQFPWVYGFNVAKLYPALNQPNTVLLIDDTLESYSLKGFRKLNQFIRRYNIQNKVIYATSHLDVQEEYELWLKTSGEERLFTVYAMNNWFWRHRDWVNDCGNEVNLNKKVWFSFVQNRHRFHRIAAHLYLDYLGLSDKGIISANYYRLIDFVHYKPFANRDILEAQIPILEKKLPIYLDKPETMGLELRSFANDLNPVLYDDPLINLVSETNYLTQGYNKVSGMFITEKTGKAFTTYQMPIIIGPRGIVSLLRSYGFDMFDDIIDHSYDDLEDENRLFVALDTLKNIIDNNDIEKLNKKTRVRRRKNKIFYLKKLRITDIEKPVSDYI